jgi:hypothetical protein
MNSFKITALDPADASAFFTRHADNSKAKKKELEQFLNRVCGSYERLDELAYVGLKDHGTTEFGRQCGLLPCAPEHLREIQGIVFASLTSGTMKVNGKRGHWNNGDMGSRWFDFDHGGADVRVSFQSRKFSDEEWTLDEDYAILISVERAE